MEIVYGHYTENVGLAESSTENFISLFRPDLLLFEFFFFFFLLFFHPVQNSSRNFLHELQRRIPYSFNNAHFDILTLCLLFLSRSLALSFYFHLSRLSLKCKTLSCWIRKTRRPITRLKRCILRWKLAAPVENQLRVRTRPYKGMYSELAEPNFIFS